MEKLDISRFTNVKPELKDLVELDLYQLGISGADLNSVDIVTEASALMRILRNRFRYGKNVIIFGTRGFGKTDMVKQAAESAGMRPVVESTATRLPEDYGGIPMAFDVEIPDSVYKAMIKANIKNRKIQQLIQQEIDSTPTVVNPKILRAALARKYGATVSVSDDELQQVIDAAEELPPKKRLEQQFAAPDWVHQAIDLYKTTGKKTLLFLDEINQASPAVLNSLFGLIQSKKFADRDIYDLSECMVFAAAGNFPRENPSVQQLPSPLIDRFQKVILFYATWDDSIDYLKDSYYQFSATNPELVNLLNNSNISVDAWKASFSSPRNMEVFIQQLKDMEDEARAGVTAEPFTDADISSYIQGSNVTSLRDALITFWKRLGIYSGGYNSTSSSSNAQNIARANAIFKSHWTKYKLAVSQGNRYAINGTPYDGSDAGKKALYTRLTESMRIKPTRELLESLDAYQELLDAGVDPSKLPQ